MSFRDKIEQFIVKEICAELNIDHSEHIEDDEPLVDSGIIDSLGILKILSFLDEECGIDLGSEEITPAKFATLRSICELVEQQAKE
jgi:acyl carrier protein